MNTFLINPYWLFGYDVVFNVVLTLITAVISYYSFKAYRLSHTRRPRLFCYSMAIYSLAYLIQAVFGIMAVVGNSSISALYTGTYLHLFIFIIGSVTMAYMVSDIKKPGIYFLLLAVSLFPLIFFSMDLYLEYVIISTILFYVFVSYIMRFIEKRKSISIIVPVAFGLLFISTLNLIFSVKNPAFYIIGNIIELISYMLLLINLVVALTK